METPGSFPPHVLDNEVPEQNIENEDRLTRRNILKRVLYGIGYTIAVLFFLYFFLVGLDLMGDAFKILSGDSPDNLFEFATNPVTGLIVGILATVLVQSSSTTTSIIVSAVGSGALPVSTAIPMIFGANIGTSVTNTLVSLTFFSRDEYYERAFSAATVHDLFNLFNVAIWMIIEPITNAINGGNGGLLFIMSDTITKGFEPCDKSTETCKKWKGPIKKITGDLTDKIVESIETTTSDPDVAGILALLLSLVMLTSCLYFMVKTLNHALRGPVEQVVKRAMDMNGYLAILVGIGVTMFVQSSSITTSVLTPLVAIEVLTLEQMVPLTMGANIGTTFTGVLAALVGSSIAGMQIAVVHVLFNVIGVFTWYPIPRIRQVPINCAKFLGTVAAKYKPFPAIYVIMAFGIYPLVILGLSLGFASANGGILAATIISLLVFITLHYWCYHWYTKRGGKKWIESRFASKVSTEV